MDFIHSAVLGLVQGLTEFIPVSSTGHLILARKIMGLDLVGTLSFDAILQLATGLAVLIYFWSDIWKLISYCFNFIADYFKKKENIKEKSIDDKRTGRLLLALIIGTIPALVLGLFLQGYMDTVFRGTQVVAYALIVGAILFYFAEKVAKKNSFKNLAADMVVDAKDTRESKAKEDQLCVLTINEREEFSNVSIWRALTIGLFQCLALIPGMSRSGSTISGGLFSGFSRELAARFSFLLSIPIILGSGLKKVFDLYQTGALAQVESSLFIASIFAFISGLLAIHFLLKFLKNHSLNYFGVYRIILAVLILIFI